MIEKVLFCLALVAALFFLVLGGYAMVFNLRLLVRRLRGLDKHVSPVLLVSFVCLCVVVVLCVGCFPDVTWIRYALLTLADVDMIVEVALLIQDIRCRASDKSEFDDGRSRERK